MNAAAARAGPRAHFLSGHLADVTRDPLGFLAACAREYGDVVPLRFGIKRAFFLNHPSYIESVLVANREHFVKGPVVRSASRLYGQGLFLSEGLQWRKQRHAAQPAFHPARVAAAAGVIVRQTEQMLAGWQDGQLRDVQRDMLRLMLATTAEALFGATVSGGTDSFIDALMEALDAIAARVQGPSFLLPDSIPTPANLRLRRAVQRLDAVVADVIAQRRAVDEPRDDLLTLLMADANGDPASARRLRDGVMNFLLAGYESSAVALCWTWYLLAEHPEVEATLIAELDRTLTGSPGLDDVAHLRYTKSVILESMRLYPPVPLLGREAIRECSVGGLRVPRGALVVASQWVMHRDPRYFDRPAVFDPDRWSADLLESLPRCVFFPFGGGPRGCIGSSFAMLELTLILATMARQIRLARVAGHPVVPVASSTLFVKHGMPMVVARRRPSESAV